jgi:shikimate dehydrogenase
MNNDQLVKFQAQQWTTQAKIFGHLSNATELRSLGGVVEFINTKLANALADSIYIPLQVSPENLGTVIDGMRSLRYFSGFTVTMPHKEPAYHFCDNILPNALGCTAVNAIRVEADGSLTGDCFDGQGFIHAIEQRRPITNQLQVLVYGAGGVGQAIVVALAAANVGTLHIVNRTATKAKKCAYNAIKVSNSINISYGNEYNLSNYDVIVQATSLGSGSSQEMVPIDFSLVKSSCLVVEAVRTPETTPFLDHAIQHGLEVIRGNQMLLPQIEKIIHFLGMI